MSCVCHMFFPVFTGAVCSFSSPVCFLAFFRFASRFPPPPLVFRQFTPCFCVALLQPLPSAGKKQNKKREAHIKTEAHMLSNSGKKLHLFNVFLAIYTMLLCFLHFSACPGFLLALLFQLHIILVGSALLTMFWNRVMLAMLAMLA